MNTHLAVNGDLPIWATFLAGALAVMSLAVLFFYELRQRERGGIGIVLTGTLAVVALLAAIAGLAPIALYPGRGALWPAGGLAAGLTVVGGPAAWPALAALAPSPMLRIALALHGAVVAAVVATATSVPLLDVPAGDLITVATEFVLPLAGIWAVAAVLLGIVVRGRTFTADFTAAALWTGAVGGAMVGAQVAAGAPLLWAGPAAAAILVVAARAVARDRELAVQGPV